jgi:hypothetical protein
VISDRAGFLEGLLRLLEESGARYCVIGWQGVNAYVEPVVSLDLDIAVATADLGRIERLLGEHFPVARFTHSLNVSVPESDLRVQISTDPRYGSFADRAERRRVLGLTLPVATVEDVLQGKIWAALDPQRRPSKRQKDLADIARLIEWQPELRAHVPPELLARLI